MHDDYCTECFGELVMSDQGELYCPECDPQDSDPFTDEEGTIAEVDFNVELYIH